jgi:hypothetical protein
VGCLAFSGRKISDPFKKHNKNNALYGESLAGARRVNPNRAHNDSVNVARRR